MSSLSCLLFRRCLAFLAAVLLCLAAPARAEAPMANTQVPGYYRMKLGQYEITALFDGSLALDATRFKHPNRKEVEQLLLRSFSEKDKVRLSVNAYLINTGKQLVLVDAGGAGVYGKRLGRLLANLKASGYSAYDVDAVILTHMHPDHVAGLIDNDKDPVFPNATVYVEEAEAQYWLSAENEAAAPKEWTRIFIAARNAATPYIENEKWKTFTIGAQLLPGIGTLPARGHTPGHTIVTVKSEAQRMLILGDVMHSHAIQFARPEITFDFDLDPQQARETRRAILKRLSMSGDLAAAAHLPFPGMGRVRTEGAGRYAWVPVPFSPLPETKQP